MRVYTKVQGFITDDGVVIVTHRESYDGVITDYAKKGRESQATITQDDINRSHVNDAYTAQQRAAAQPTIASWEASSKPGSVSPAAAAQLANDQNNIAKTYTGLRETAYAGLGQRGFGGAPSGFEKSVSNGIDQGEANANTGAFRNAQQNTQNLQNQAVQARLGQANTGLAGAQAASNGGAQSAYDQAHMGSTAGDILGGVGQVAGIAGDVMGMIPKAAAAPFGASGLDNLPLYNPQSSILTKSNPFANIGKSGGSQSNVGGYG